MFWKLCGGLGLGRLGGLGYWEMDWTGIGIARGRGEWRENRNLCTSYLGIEWIFV